MTSNDRDWASAKGLRAESFEWDDEKRRANLVKHGIDFFDAAEALLEDHVVCESPGRSERRFIAVAAIDSRHIAVIFTMRDRACRIISARAARRHERKAYQALLDRRDQRKAPRQD
jgi:uncharacterized DUF497 family protein